MSNAPQIKERDTAARDEIAASVRGFIARAGVSKSAVARAIGMAQSTFSRRTTGDEPFDADELGLLANYFDVTLVDLVAGNVHKIAPNAKKAPVFADGGLRVVHPLGLEPRTHWITAGEVTPLQARGARKPMKPRGRRDRSTGPKGRAA